MIELITAVMIMIGALFCTLAAIGILRLPDVFNRMQASAKGGTLGAGMSILAAGVYFMELGVAIRTLLVVAFLFLTAPIAAHMIARAAYSAGVPLWKGSVIDELRKYRDRTRRD